MNWLFHYWLLILVGGIISIVALAGSAILEAWLDFKGKPKEPMFWCHIHGPFRKKHCLPLFPEMGGTAENSFICPTCYYEKVFKDPKVRLN